MLLPGNKRSSLINSNMSDGEKTFYSSDTCPNERVLKNDVDVTLQRRLSTGDKVAI